MRAAPDGSDRFFLARLYRAAKWLTLLAGVLVLAGLLAGHLLPGTSQSWMWQDPNRTLGPSTRVDWFGVDGAIREVLREARGRARDRASARLDEWRSSLMERVDRDLLPWYFAFWGQQWRDLKAVGYLIGDWGGWARAEEAMRSDFRDAFATRVMPPGETQMRMEAIAREALNAYLEHARRELPAIPARYRVPREDWRQHLAQIGLHLRQTSSQDESVPTTLKGLVTFGAAGTTAVLLRSGPALSRVGRRAAAWARAGGAGTPGSALSGGALRGGVARTGATRAGRTGLRVGGRFLGAGAFVALLAWDIYDHHRREAELRSRLRARIASYLKALGNRMLEDSTHGVLAPVHELESRVHRQLASSSPSPREAGG